MKGTFAFQVALVFGSTLPRTPGPAIRLACGSPLTHTAVSSFWLASHTPPARGPGQLASLPKRKELNPEANGHRRVTSRPSRPP